MTFIVPSTNSSQTYSKRKYLISTHRAAVSLQAKPGKKGISLTKDQAEALLSKLDDLSGALSQQQEVSIGLGPKYADPPFKLAVFTLLLAS